jgi:hypothetical protein
MSSQGSLTSIFWLFGEVVDPLATFSRACGVLFAVRAARLPAWTAVGALCLWCIILLAAVYTTYANTCLCTCAWVLDESFLSVSCLYVSYVCVFPFYLVCTGLYNAVLATVPLLLLCHRGVSWCQGCTRMTHALVCIVCPNFWQLYGTKCAMDSGQGP